MTQGLLLALAVACGLLVAGCGSGSNGGGQGSVTPPVTAPPVTQGSLQLLAGSIGGAGNLDGAGTAARISAAGSPVSDAAGNIYYSDPFVRVIRKVTVDGKVSILAGKSGASGNTDGAGEAARFNFPLDLVIDSKGDLLVLDSKVIRKVSASGVVSTIPTSDFKIVSHLAIDKQDNLYISDTGDHHVYKLTPGGTLSMVPVYLGSADTPVMIGEGYNYNGQRGVAVDVAGNLYAAETANNRIRKITPDGTASVFANLPKPYTLKLDASSGLIATSERTLYKIAADGSATVSPITPAGPAAAACATDLQNIGIGFNDNLLINAGAVLCRVANGAATVVAGMAKETGRTDGVGDAARFNYIGGMTLDNAGNVYLTHGTDLRKITPAGVVSTVLSGAFTGVGTQGLVMDGSGNLLVIDGCNILKVTPAGVVSKLAGRGNIVPFYADGSGDAAGFAYPQGITVDGDGNAYVADSNNSAIRKVTPAGVVTTIVAPNALPTDRPLGITIDSAGNLYVTGRNGVYKVTQAGVVSTLAPNTAFNGAYGIGIDKSGNLYVAETDNHTVRKITPAGVVSTVAGSAGIQGISLGTLPATLDSPRHLAVSGDGNIYVSTPAAVLAIK